MDQTPLSADVIPEDLLDRLKESGLLSAEEINRAVGPGTSNLVRKFLLLFNENTCAQLGNPVAPHNYTYGLVHIDASSHTISITPKDQNGDSVAGNGVVGGGGDPQCYSYEATAA